MKILQTRLSPARGAVALVADIGGTNSNFALVSLHKGKYSINRKYDVKSKEIASFENALAQVLALAGRRVKCVCVAGAGPVVGGKLKLTNLPWTIDASKIKKKLGLSVRLLNDFTALAYGIDHLPRSSIEVLKKGKALKQAPRLVVGPGTGLGISVLLWQGKSYVPIATELMHVGFIVEDKRDFQVLSFMQRLLKRKVIDWEDVVSGRGLGHLYRFVSVGKKGEQHGEIKKSMYSAAVIWKAAETDRLAREAVKLFVHYLARCIGHFTVGFQTRGGIYIAGGIVAHHGKWFEKYFSRSFESFGRLSGFVKGVPIKMVLDYDVSLLGAAAAVLE